MIEIGWLQHSFTESWKQMLAGWIPAPATIHRNCTRWFYWFLINIASTGAVSAKLRQVLVQEGVQIGMSRLLKQRPNRRHPPPLPLLYISCIMRELAHDQNHKTACQACQLGAPAWVPHTARRIE